MLLNLNYVNLYIFIARNKILNLTWKIMKTYVLITKCKPLEETAGKARELCNLSERVKNKLKALELTKFWFKLNTFKNAANEKIFGNLCEFVFNIFSLPHSSASAERIFSQLN
ncbi:unnamed protein product [Psylliodes chrysocephalus]|uniref:HAT C-terminal dimerisation domain-containing protein n=1 Tax=Psylliodes chrysocephalus TaxID=3402493 RepID=A0A9P0D379_9CUCU|nr:unnamed protein product [Psylliodes chrysocephala]